MNNMICRKLRSRKGKKYFYCSKQRTEIPLEEAGTVTTLTCGDIP